MKKNERFKQYVKQTKKKSLNAKNMNIAFTDFGKLLYLRIGYRLRFAGQLTSCIKALQPGLVKTGEILTLIYQLSKIRNYGKWCLYG